MLWQVCIRQTAIPSHDHHIIQSTRLTLLHGGIQVSQELCLAALVPAHAALVLAAAGRHGRHRAEAVRLGAHVFQQEHLDVARICAAGILLLTLLLHCFCWLPVVRIGILRPCGLLLRDAQDAA